MPRGEPMECSHEIGAVCWLCSNQAGWWAAARTKAGYDYYIPPNYVKRVQAEAAQFDRRVEQVAHESWSYQKRFIETEEQRKAKRWEARAI